MLYQQKRGDDKTAYSERKKSDLQNEHRAQLAADRPARGRRDRSAAEANRWVEFKIDKLEAVSLPNVAAASGNERKLSATATGWISVARAQASQECQARHRRHLSGDKAQSIHVKTSDRSISAWKSSK